MNKSAEKGKNGEKFVAQYLESKGFKICRTNYHSRYGEIDIICENEKYIVFVEVKYRRTGQKGDPAEAVDYRKQKKISKVAEYYCWKKRKLNQPCRFDVICVLGQEIRHIEHAFECCI